MNTNSRNALISLLREIDQRQLVESIEKGSYSQNQVEKLLQQLNSLEHTYTGGIRAYMKKAKELVAEMKLGVQSVPEFIKPPTNHIHISINQEYVELEEIARPFLGDTAFVLVAGGLGERLGSKKIKISLICELMTSTTFIDLYLSYMKNFSQIARKKMNLFIMTSDDTHDETVKLLASKIYSSYVNIHIEKQDKIPSIKNFDLELDIDEKLELQTKPHGHGDVHFLIRNSKIISKWKSDGLKYAYFIQDTNPFSLACYPAMLGITMKNGFHLNFMAITRKPDEAVGALIVDEQGRTFNIEYNILTNFFKRNNIPEPTNEEGYCLYPGNINCFLLELNEYERILEDISHLKEFINPKVDKKNPDKLLSSFRIECLMQDIAFSIGDSSKIGVAEFSRHIAFTTCKNNLETGKANQLRGLPSESIIECENDIYRRNYELLKFCGINFQKGLQGRSYSDLIEGRRKINDYSVPYAPRIFIHPSFGVLVNDIKRRFKNVTFELSRDFSIVLKGRVVIENCHIDSVSLWIENKSDDLSRDLTVRNVTFSGDLNDVIDFVPLEIDEDTKSTAHLMRGYKIAGEEKISYIVC